VGAAEEGREEQRVDDLGLAVAEPPHSGQGGFGPGQAMGIVEDILKAGDLNDAARMRDLILEKKNSLHAAVIPSGHLFAQMAGRRLSVSAWRTEQWHGRTQLRFIAGTADRLSDRGEELREKLMRLREIVFVRNRLHLNMTADEAGLQLLADAAGRLSTLPARSPSARVEEKLPRPAHVGIAIPAQSAMWPKSPGRSLPRPAFRPLFVLAKQLSNGYLYRHIRFGPMAALRYEPLSGLFAFLLPGSPPRGNPDIYRAVDDVSRNPVCRRSWRRLSSVPSEPWTGRWTRPAGDTPP
jgi:Zn-dependent M16 (insulinase) family peptidase